MSRSKDIQKQVDELIAEKRGTPLVDKNSPHEQLRMAREQAKYPKPKPKPTPMPIHREPEPEPQYRNMDMLEEQTQEPFTTTHSSIAEADLHNVYDNPAGYIEINMIKKSRVVDTFFVQADLKEFDYNEKYYDIDEEGVYILPRAGLFVPTAFYSEGMADPVGFKQTNTGITGKALSLLYRHNLYATLLQGDDNKYNIFIIILLIITMVVLAVICFFVFGDGGEVINQMVQGGGDAGGMA